MRNPVNRQVERSRLYQPNLAVQMRLLRFVRSPDLLRRLVNFKPDVSGLQQTAG